MITRRKQLASALTAAATATTVTGTANGATDLLAQSSVVMDMMQGSFLTAVAVAGLAVAWGLAARRNRRLQLVSDAADRLARGDHNTRITVTGNDAVARLAASVNRLASELSAAPASPAASAIAQPIEPSHDSTASALASRTAFLDRLSGLCIAPARDFAVMVIEIDRFAVIGDTYGKLASDDVLQAVCTRLGELASPASVSAFSTPCRIDLIARLKDGEFAILVDRLPTEDPARRSALGEVTACVREITTEPVEVAGSEVILAPSIGVVVARADHDAAASLMRDANDALARARAAGRNRSVIFDPAIHAEAIERLRLETALRNALVNSELSLSYQPISNLGDRSILGFEALLRWNHRGQAISPAVFVPVAEDAGLMVDIGEWVIAAALRQLRQWTDAAGRPLSVSVNVTRRQASDPNLPGHIRKHLDANRLNAASLTLEIKESILLESMEARSMIEQVRGLGVRVHIDDFGTTYRSLSSLNLYPADGLKIDRAFILDQASRKDPRTVLQAIVKLSHDLGMPVVAEGIETSEQAELLESLDFDRGQGYHLARPMTADQATQLLETKQMRTLAA